ncbi:MAG: glucose dehydrogenase [Chloroflexi bacterium]|nr:glucose dehydrogenase [Chloroflexota bacterium]
MKHIRLLITLTVFLVGCQFSSSTGDSTLASQDALVVAAPTTAVTTDTLESYEIALAPVSSGLDRPGYVFVLQDGALAVIEQAGVIRRLSDGASWLDMRDLVDADSSERGLFSVVFSPFSDELFVSYSRRSDAATVVSRMPLVNGAPNIEDIALVIAIEQPYANHNGGFMAFGPGDYLYIATGDGGSGNDPQNNAQNPQSLLGKVLRLDVRDATVPYTIPGAQPVQQHWLPEIISIGLRNPWRFGFINDESIWIADVGQSQLEELNVVAVDRLMGANFGWRLREGNLCRPGESDACNDTTLTDPVAVYAHDEGHCSITGGEVIRHPRDTTTDALIYGDFCSGTLWLWDAQQGAQRIADTDLQISSFGIDENQNLFVSDYRTGQVLALKITTKVE